MFRKQKRIQAVCKNRKCGFTELRPYVHYPSVPNRAELAGMKMQAFGARSSVFMGGHKKGGYAAAAAIAEAARTEQQLREVCPQCMGKLKLIVVRVKV